MHASESEPYILVCSMICACSCGNFHEQGVCSSDDGVHELIVYDDILVDVLALWTVVIARWLLLEFNATVFLVSGRLGVARGRWVAAAVDGHVYQ